MRSEPSFPTQSSLSQRAPRQRYRWLQMLLLMGFGLFLFVSIVALVALWWIAGDRPLDTTDQVISVETEAINPALALMYLAGDPVEPLAYQALQAGEYATSHALTAFGIHNMPTSRATLLLQLSQIFEEQGNTDLSARLLRNSRTIALLDTRFTPLERADLLLQCVKGFLALELPAEATDAATQIKRIAEQTPDLLPAERNRVLQSLLPLTARLPESVLQQQVQELARSPYLNPGGLVIIRPIYPSEGSIEFDNELTTIVQQRQLLARQLAEQILRSPIADTTPLQQALAEALRKEDEQRALYFTQILASQNLTFSLQFWTLQEQERWLLLKLAVSHRAFGLSLVPEWEENRFAIFTELSDITDQLEVALSTLPEAEPEPLDQLLQRIVALRWLAMQTELGFYPQRRAAEIGEQLRIAQEELSVYGTSAALPIHYDVNAVPPGYRIQRSR